MIAAILVLIGCSGKGADTGDTPGEDTEVTAFVLDYRTDPDPPVAGEPAELWYSILDQDGEPVENLQQNHQRMVHVVILSEDLSSFEHRHHEDQYDVTADDLRTATFHLTETFPYSGKFLVAFDYAYANQYKQSTVYEEVAGDVPQRDAPVEDLSTTVTIDGYTAVFSWDVPPIAGYESQIWAHVTDDQGEEITDMTQWLGADAHWVVAKSDVSLIAHTHAYIEGMDKVPPDHDMPHAYSGPDLPFHYTFANAGLYKSWLQFAREGAPDDPVTIPFMFKVSP